ncbi:MAG: T9SS type A sorting domain-containing protein [Bacteroidales bacterium]
MKKLLLFTAFSIAMSGLGAQYQGTPWYGTPWAFGEDSAANLSVGLGIATKNTFANGVLHSAYDVGVVDTLLRPVGDPGGALVAGSGVINSSATNGDYRRPQATADGVSLDQSDIDAIESPNFGAMFSSHDNRGVTGKTGGWYRYTCNFSSNGNYKMVLRMWGNSDPGYAAWVRFYDKATMTPLYPWVRFNPGDGDGGDLEGASLIDVTSETFDTIVNKQGAPRGQTWIELNDGLTLNGEVVVEYSDVGPSEAYGENIRGAGSGNFGEFLFLFTGEASDEFAPVAEVYKESYDDMEEISLTLTEDGTLYLVPAGTAIEDAETANIDKMVMTTSDTYTKAVKELDLQQDIQIVTMDAAGNSRITTPITLQKAFTADTTQGVTGDTIYLNTTRAGTVYLVPSNVNGDFTSLSVAFAGGNADTAAVTGGVDSLIITTLTGDLDCNLWLYDALTGEISDPIAFQLGAGGDPSSVQLQNLRDLTVSFYHNEIIVQHNADYNELAVYDILGKQHIRKSVHSNRISVNANDLNDGVYIIRLTGNSGIATRKFLLSR